MSGNFLTIPGDDPIQKRSRSSSLTDLISAFDTKAQTHTDLQKVTAFSGSFDKNFKPTFSKEEYGNRPTNTSAGRGRRVALPNELVQFGSVTLLPRPTAPARLLCLDVFVGRLPVPGSMTEFRGAEAQARVCSEMKELCEIINDYGKVPCKNLLPPELANATKYILFGELFTLYTIINDKLVGLLIRTRKHHLTYFEGEVLFQKRDDDVPIFLMMPINEIRSYCDNRALQARRSVSPMPERR